jgi:ABC-type transport system involved in multi-copper enzyme maturation permease subunit
MNSIWYSLAWKEWHEHKWKLVSMVAILWGAAALALAALKFETDDLFGVAVATVGLCLLPLAMFIGLGAAASERSRNTLPFLQSLPAPLWRVAIMKVVFGLFSLLVAAALAIALILAWKYVAELAGHDMRIALRQFQSQSGSISGRWYVDCFIVLAPVALSVFAWSAAAGVNRRDEISAGAMAVAAVVGWGLLLFLAFLVLTRWFINIDHPSYRDEWTWLGVLAYSTLPGGTFSGSTISTTANPPISLALTCITAAGTYSLLLAWYVYRFGKITNLEIRSRQSAARQSARTDWLSAPRRFPASAIIWKQVRESGPIAIAGIAVCAGVTLMAVIISLLDRHQSIPETVGGAYPFMAVFFGTIVSLVAGIGICFGDMTPKVNEFWRSRPIQPDQWFWIKFVTGFLVVLASIYVPIGILAAIQIPVSQGWEGADAAYLPPMVQLAVFAAAVATTCLVRQAVYAYILSIAVVYLGTLSGMAIYLLPAWLRSENVNLFRDPSPLQTAFGLATSFAISTFLAWLAVRYDWGKKSRY